LKLCCSQTKEHERKRGGEVGSFEFQESGVIKQTTRFDDQICSIINPYSDLRTNQRAVGLSKQENVHKYLYVSRANQWYK
jgi:hypothetical protein